MSKKQNDKSNDNYLLERVSSFLDECEKTLEPAEYQKIVDELKETIEKRMKQLQNKPICKYKNCNKPAEDFLDYNYCKYHDSQING